MINWRRYSTHLMLLAAVFALAWASASCGGSSSGNSNNTQSQAISVSLTPGTAQKLDQGQSLTIRATVSNDSANKGVTWSVTGAGTLGSQTSTSVVYTAPASVTSATSAAVTATSAASSSATASLSITVNPNPAVSTTTLAAATVGTAYSATLQATGGSGGLTWSVSQGSLPAWATLNASTGAISGTPTAAGTATFSVTVKDGAGVTSAAQALTLTATPAALAITTTTLPNAEVGTAYSASLQAAGGVAPYQWSITSGAFPAWASLDPSTGAITGTPTTAASATFTVQVQDSESTPATATESLTLVTTAAGANSGALKGQYAFELSDSSAPEVLVGSLTADGAGNITGGEFDLQSASAAQVADTITGGSYTVGADNRGVLSFHDGGGRTYGFDIALGTVTGGVASWGGMTESDGAHLLSGELDQQNPNDFSASSLSGGYAFELAGDGGTFAEVGSFIVSGGAITAGLLDSNTSGTMVTAAPFTGSIATVDGNGRGTVTVSAGGTPATIAFYVVNASRLDAVLSNMTAGQAIAGVVVQQAGGPYTAAALDGNAVITTQGSTGVPSPHVALGVVTFDGNGNASGVTDTNDGGTINSDQTISGLTYTITSAANGRFTLNGNGLPYAQVGYLTGPNAAFVIDSAPLPDLSTAVAQSAGTFSTASVKGTYAIATQPTLAAPVNPPNGVPTVTYETGTVTLDGSGSLSGTVDDVQASGVSSGTAISDTYSAASNGRVTLGSGNLVAYIVSPTRILMLEVEQGNPNPTVRELRQ